MDNQYEVRSRFETNFTGDLAFLSNMHLFERDFVCPNLIGYPSVTHFIGAMSFSNLTVRRYIAEHVLARDVPEFCRHLHNVFGFRQDWVNVRSSVFTTAIYYKFSKHNPIARRCLLSLDPNQEIVFLNNWNDVYWGYDCTTHEGENNLGKMLSWVKDVIHFEEENPSTEKKHVDDRASLNVRTKGFIVTQYSEDDLNEMEYSSRVEILVHRFMRRYMFGDKQHIKAPHYIKPKLKLS